jgi:zinc protease
MIGRFAVIVMMVSCLAMPTRAAFQIQRVVSPGGIEAWLIEDHHVPIMALDLSFQGGAALDPKGKEGLALMTASLMDEGAGTLDSTAFQKELADKSITFNFNASLDSFSGSVKTLTKYRDRAFDMLALSLTKPRFDADAVERVRREMVTTISSNLGKPNWIARRKVMETVFEGHPYSRPINGTVPSLNAINVADMRGFLKARIGRDQLLVTAAGDITPAELGQALDRIFAGVPAKAAPFSIPEATIHGAGQTIVIQREGAPQTIISMAEAGIKRDDPDWYTGQILNYTLAGGGFNSRLMEDVRGAESKRGLAYGISSSFAAFKHGGIIQIASATKNSTAGEVLGIVKDELGRVHKDGITEAEITDAKTYITGSFPLSFTSTDKLAGLLMQLREENLGIDYLERRDGLIDAVTLDDAKRVAARLINPDAMMTVLVGKPEGLAKPENPTPAKP